MDNNNNRNIFNNNNNNSNNNNNKMNPHVQQQFTSQNYYHILPPEYYTFFIPQPHFHLQQENIHQSTTLAIHKPVSPFDRSTNTNEQFKGSIPVIEILDNDSEGLDIADIESIQENYTPRINSIPMTYNQHQHQLQDQDDDDIEDNYNYDQDEENQDDNFNYYYNDDEDQDDQEEEAQDQEILSKSYLEFIQVKEISIKKKIQKLRDFNVKIQRDVDKVLHQIFTQFSSSLVLKGAKDYSHLKYKTLDPNLNTYIQQEKIDTHSSKKNLDILFPLYNREISNIERMMKEFIYCSSVVHDLFSLIRPCHKTELEASINHIQGYFILMMAHQKSFACGFLYKLKTIFGQPKGSPKSRRTLNDEYKSFINDYFDTNSTDPYPNDDEKAIISGICNISKYQRNNWFSNKRSREKNQRIACLNNKNNNNSLHNLNKKKK
ncbi:hypothetical protein CYY_005129 [Polysphondylium violaceum]|uniref:Homeobox domain-containing protein n=1 Tax=Polysphondylium violaceum TaxID=133409 RepID=A0A8J4UZU6_9MYCE|nr:hypothetical protein CYY_005129 [Polysphondylium violaceum]